MPIIDDTVKRLKRRVDEQIMEGRNKVRLIIGTDRKNTIDSGYGSGGANDKESGAFIVTVGGDEEDINLTEDDVVFLMSGKTDLDDYFAVDMGEEKTESSGAVLSSGNVYLVAKDSIKIFRDGYVINLTDSGIVIERKNGSKITLDENGLTLGEGQEEFAPLGQKLKTWLETSTVQTAMGPAKFNPADIQRFVSDVLSTVVKIG